MRNMITNSIPYRIILFVKKKADRLFYWVEKTKQESYFFKKTDNIRNSLTASYNHSCLRLFQFKFIKTLAIIRKNSIGSISLTMILKLVNIFYLIYVKIFNPKSLRNSAALTYLKGLQGDVGVLPLSGIGKIILLILGGNIFLCLIFERNIDLIGWYFRAVWFLIGTILLLIPCRVSEIMKYSGFAKFVAKINKKGNI